MLKNADLGHIISCRLIRLTLMNYFTHNINDSSLSGGNVSLVNLSDFAKEREREIKKDKECGVIING